MTGVPKVARMEEQVRFSDRANSRDTIPIRPTTNQVLFLEFQGHHKLLTDNI